MEYIDFASRISFYEFLQGEFKKPHFDTTKYEEEMSLLEKKINIEYLTKILGSNPRIIDIFEELFQLKRFTNAQYINFCFDVNVLNNFEESLVIKYIQTRVFKFENGSDNSSFVDIYDRIAKSSTGEEREIIFNVKRGIINYIDKCQKERTILYSHLQNSIDARLRIAKYLIENLNADDYLSSVNLETFLRFKRHPVDTKGLHGHFGIMKINKILEGSGFVNAGEQVVKKTLSINDSISNESSKNKFCFLREKTIQGINKRKDGKPKVFDFVLLYNGVPRIGIETNFYTTSGTKIGINEGEYVDLLEDINEFNQEKDTGLKFIWITDGNYWLTRDGENRFMNLKTNYFKNRYELLNYSLFRDSLDDIKKEMENQ